MFRISLALTLLLIASPLCADDSGNSLKLDESPATVSEWGYRPASGGTSQTNPPSFSWRPQKGIVRWELECSTGKDFRADQIVYRQDQIKFNVHCPARTLEKHKLFWRYRGIDKQNRHTPWSQTRQFTIAQDATHMPLPERKELLSRIPKSHPRLFIRPEDLPRLRDQAQGELRDEYASLVAHCERLLNHPPATEEPIKYPPEIIRGSEPWKAIWWGNRNDTIEALHSAATLGFTRRLGGKDEYGQLAKQILLECAEWDPRGATGYRYNDEAGMPYAYHFSRTYSFVYDLLNEEERELCRNVMRIRGQEMYDHLCPSHFWNPYNSHRNRAWHFLGEIGVAFHGEIAEADDWVVFATNVFYNTYPVWSDDDGGWHEGVRYWGSYVNRFTWWADVMRSALAIDAYQKPYFASAGYYPMYILPPGKVGGGFGDLTAEVTSDSHLGLIAQLASQSRNGHWLWYLNQHGGPKRQPGHIGFVRQSAPKTNPIVPTDLPTARHFRGAGQAFLNTTLENAADNVQVGFKSSPFGTRSHGYEANNSFLLSAYGERLLIRSGRRDAYGSSHHKNWMWSPRSVNNITIANKKIAGREAWQTGEITDFQTTPTLDLVVGEAGGCYRESENAPSLLKRYTRAILFIKPELVIVYDRLVAHEPSRFQYWLHATNKFKVSDQQNIDLKVRDARCDISFLAPRDLRFEQTNQYDPNPRERIRLREWHLTAEPPSEQESLEFVTLFRPHRENEKPPSEATLKETPDSYHLVARLSDGQVTATLPKNDNPIVVTRRDAQGKTIETLSTN